MRELSQTIASSYIYVFPSGPIPVTTGKFGSGGFPANGGWYAGNPASIQPIQYYLKDRVSSGEVKIEIYDASGKLVQTVPATKRKGINKVYWNLRYTPPKVAKGGAKLDGGAFTAPQVMPGDYKMKLKIGSKEYTSDLKLVHDTSNRSFTLEDRTLQHASAMKLYQMHEDLSALVEKISAEQKLVKESDTAIKTVKTRKMTDEYHAKLETLRSELLATKQKSIFADEEKLREQISEIYSAISYQEARPTNLQLERIAQLQEEIKKANENYTKLNESYAAKVREAIDAEKKIGAGGKARSSN
ncbi:MAG: hypothetical protein EOP49_01375 [Sphingobacteriales bacterium]|nr:MAG: hypothetical protein EOP49_01375 [Sphingobacteriales bacterium]